MLYIIFQYTAKLNGANLAAFEDAEIQAEKVPETDDDLLDMEEQLKKIIYERHKGTPFENFKFESIRWKLK